MRLTAHINLEISQPLNRVQSMNISSKPVNPLMTASIGPNGEVNIEKIKQKRREAHIMLNKIIS
jgi:hypothetical protein